MPVLVKHLWQLKTVVFHHRCPICFALFHVMVQFQARAHLILLGAGVTKTPGSFPSQGTFDSLCLSGIITVLILAIFTKPLMLSLR